MCSKYRPGLPGGVLTVLLSIRIYSSLYIIRTLVQVPFFSFLSFSKRPHPILINRDIAVRKRILKKSPNVTLYHCIATDPHNAQAVRQPRRSTRLCRWNTHRLLCLKSSWRTTRKSCWPRGIACLHGSLWCASCRREATMQRHS